MGGRSPIWYIAASAMVLAACNERPEDAPTAPSFAGGKTAVCSFSNVGNLTRTEFGSNSVESGLATDMKNAGAGTNSATSLGYQILDSIAEKYETPAASTTNAAQLTVALLGCMYVGGATIPSSATFEDALSSTGAFGVRGVGTTADKRTLYSHDGSWLLEPPATSNWQAITSANDTITDPPLKDALLVYGYPVLDGNFSADTLYSSVFEWATLPTATFDPGVIIGECTQDPSYLQHNSLSSTTSKPEVLGNVDPGCVSQTGMAEPTPRSLAERIARFFEPAPLAAATVLATGTGGSKTSLSPFGVVHPGKTVLVPDQGWKWSKSGNTVNTYFTPTVVYDVRSLGNSPFLQPYILVWLEATNNQGSKVKVCNNWAYTDANGIANLRHAYLNKAGGYTITTKVAGALTLDIPGVGTVTVPRVPPGAALSSPLVNIKNDTSKQPPDTFGCPSFGGDLSQETPAYPGPNGS